MVLYRDASISVTPKAHILEDHAVDFLQRYQIGLAYFSENGGERLHSRFNSAAPIHAHARVSSEKLRIALTNHLSGVMPDMFQAV